ncbi:TlpA disulfide reductase family protein [Hamadaea sp. NPDC051192]|uniref:TlpA family protein disulfide reductase n=1 Tax=Hamadaea sp. NPDC051192 TaxID=3154940 RepID=UPI003420CD89
MGFLIAGLVLVGLLSLLNLLLILAMARRLRTPGVLTTVRAATGPVDRQQRRPGDRVASFSGRFDDTGLVAFLSPSCPPCQELLPEVLAYAREAGPRRVLAVVVDDNEDPAKVAEEVAAFDGLAHVVVARTGDELTGTFGVDAYPAVFLIAADGTVVMSGHDLAGVPRPARVA